jgi:hypothetical protein
MLIKNAVSEVSQARKRCTEKKRSIASTLSPLSSLKKIKSLNEGHLDFVQQQN